MIFLFQSANNVTIFVYLIISGKKKTLFRNERVTYDTTWTGFHGRFCDLYIFFGFAIYIFFSTKIIF